jgi:iron complex transport system permease protein
MLICTLGIGGLALTSLTYGPVTLSVADVWSALGGSSSDPAIAQIVTEIRGPRILTAVIAGAALGIAGVVMQALFRNPMADAWSLGLIAGGQIGVALLVTGAAFAGPAALVFLTSLQGPSLTIGAGVGVALTALAMASVARRVGSVTLLVVGLMLGFTAQGLVSVVLHFANRAGGRVFSGWNDGTFASVVSQDLGTFLLPILLGAALAFANGKGLTALMLGETAAESLGVNVVRLRRAVLASVVLLVAPVTAFCGPVTFIGLIVPHLARALAGTARIVRIVPLAAVSGAMLACAADLVVHLPWEQHFLHLNAVLAIVGAPIVVLLLLFSPSMRGQR